MLVERVTSGKTKVRGEVSPSRIKLPKDWTTVQDAIRGDEKPYRKVFKDIGATRGRIDEQTTAIFFPWGIATEKGEGEAGETYVEIGHLRGPIIEIDRRDPTKAEVTLFMKHEKISLTHGAVKFIADANGKERGIMLVPSVNEVAKLQGIRIIGNEFEFTDVAMTVGDKIVSVKREFLPTDRTRFTPQNEEVLLVTKALDIK